MIFNKAYLTSFSTLKPYIALASKGRVLDSKFKLSSELSIYNYINNTTSEIIQSENEFLTLKWCERENSDIFLACGMSNSTLEIYSYIEELKLCNTYKGFEGEVRAIDFNTSKNVIAAGSSTGVIIFINLDKPDHQYKCDIPLNYSIMCLSWNYKVSRILSVGTECGKILVLDIKNKNVALTIKNKDINIVHTIKWHPKFSTYIFAGTNMNSLVMFKLDSNSLDKIGSFKENIIGFDFLSNDILIIYSETQLDTLNINDLNLIKTESIESVHQISFSKKDPLCCYSYVKGQTEIKTSNFTNIHTNVQLAGHLIGNRNYKIQDTEFKLCENETEESSIIKILYVNKEYTFNEEIRSKIAQILIENIEKNKSEDISNNENNNFDLNDDLTINLIKNNVKYLETIEDKSLSVKFFVDLLINKKIDFEGNEYLFYILVTKDYSDLINKISNDQYRILILILFYSSLSNNEVIQLLEKFNTKLNNSLINLIINKPEKFYINSDVNIGIYNISSFFKNYGCEFNLIKNFNIKCSDPIMNEFFWYGISHGIYKDLKEIKYDNYNINQYLNVKSNVNIVDNIKNLNIDPAKNKNNSTNLTNSDKNYATKTPEKLSEEVKPSIYSGINKSVTSFATKPLKPSPSLYKGVNKSVTSFNTKPIPKHDNSVKTYSQIKTGNIGIGSLNNANINRTTIPKPNVFPKPNIPSYTANPVYSNLKSNTTLNDKNLTLQPKILNENITSSNEMSSTQVCNTNYGEIIKQFEELYNNLKQKASKKNNLIVGNKIKDATRRMVFFENNKQNLNDFIIKNINSIIEIEKSDKNVKQAIRMIVDECVETKFNECDIWMPAIAILIQLVY